MCQKFNEVAVLTFYKYCGHLVRPIVQACKAGILVAVKAVIRAISPVGGGNL